MSLKPALVGKTKIVILIWLMLLEKRPQMEKQEVIKMIPDRSSLPHSPKFNAINAPVNATWIMIEGGKAKYHGFLIC
jgi:hypothetical protein